MLVVLGRILVINNAKRMTLVRSMFFSGITTVKIQRDVVADIV